MGLVVSREAFRALRDTLGESRVVSTNGCFDLLHAGHFDILSRARALGDCLVVGLNSDGSVRRLKGDGRPVVDEQRRAAALAALPMVDFVIVFDEDTPVQTLLAVRPTVHVKGGDYDVEAMPETPVVRGLGGEVVILPLLAGYSTTSIIKQADYTT